MSAEQPVILWFRNDLRLADNPALTAAVQSGKPVIPVFIWAPEEERPWEPGGASKWWLHHALASLSDRLEAIGGRLILREGPSAQTLAALVEETGAQDVVWNRRYEPVIRHRDEQIKTELSANGINAKSYCAALLREPWDVKNKSGKPYLVYTPFSKAYFSEFEAEESLAAPKALRTPQRLPRSTELGALELLPKIAWDRGMKESWEPGEPAALRQLQSFVRKHVAQYETNRNIPGVDGTSRLSPYLHFGEIGPRQIWHAVQNASSGGQSGKVGDGAQVYLKEILWREFGYHLLFHFPHTHDTSLRENFRKFPWRRNTKRFAAWSKGQTGYPVVDAGMRELWHTGWMHNRVRMVVASFLVKHLLISWQEGAAWFWDTLVDADLASNTLGWQWTAGCGADAAPYFRIFNPTLQGEKFDADGEYVRRYVPELAKLPNRWIHRPWEAPPHVLAEAGVKLGKTYPLPVVDHAEAREAAMEAFDALSQARRG